MKEAGARRRYFRTVFGLRDDVLESVLRRSLLEDRMPTTQIDDAGGRILQLLITILMPKRVVEIGASFGYSSIQIGRALPEGGHLVSLELDPDVATIARRNIEFAGLSNRVQILNMDATEYLASQPDFGIDAVLVDGAKEAYPSYLKAAFPKLRKGGLLIADDALCWLDESEESVFSQSEIRGIDSFCRALGRSSSVFSALINSENGLMVSVRI